MSILTKKEILERVRKGEMTFDPELDEFQIQAHAVDLRLGYTFMIPKSWKLTEKGRESLQIDHYNGEQNDCYDIIELEKGQFFDLLPGEHILTSTLESIKWPDDLMSVLYPKSSTNRRGLSVDLTGIVDAGYEGQLIIPIKNNTNSQTIRIYPGERFCQITFQKLSEPSPKKNGTYHKIDVAEGFVINKKYKDYDYVKKGLVPELKREFKIKLKDNE